MRNFRQLEVWGEAIDITTSIYELTEELPAEEKFGLVSQMRRASVSISSNIAEGCSRRTSAHFAHFIDIAMGSSFELETQLIISGKLSLIKKDEVNSEIARLRILQRKLNSLRKAILR